MLEPAPGEFRLWPATRLQALFDGEADATRRATQLAAGAWAFPRSASPPTRIEDRAWEREWLKDFHAMRFGARLWVCASSRDVSRSRARWSCGSIRASLSAPARIRPRRCASSGSTKHVEPGARVIDYGCGSGILAVAAVKLGARQAHCFDIDPQALIATRDNAAANGVAERVTVHEAAEQLPRSVDVLRCEHPVGPAVRAGAKLCGARPAGRRAGAGGAHGAPGR